MDTKKCDGCDFQRPVLETPCKNCGSESFTHLNKWTGSTAYNSTNLINKDQKLDPVNPVKSTFNTVMGVGSSRSSTGAATAAKTAAQVVSGYENALLIFGVIIWGVIDLIVVFVHDLGISFKVGVIIGSILNLSLLFVATSFIKMVSEYIRFKTSLHLENLNDQTNP